MRGLHCVHQGESRSDRVRKLPVGTSFSDARRINLIAVHCNQPGGTCHAESREPRHPDLGRQSRDRPGHCEAAGTAGLYAKLGRTVAGGVSGRRTGGHAVRPRLGGDRCRVFAGLGRRDHRPVRAHRRRRAERGCRDRWVAGDRHRGGVRHHVRGQLQGTAMAGAGLSASFAGMWLGTGRECCVAGRQAAAAPPDPGLLGVETRGDGADRRDPAVGMGRRCQGNLGLPRHGRHADGRACLGAPRASSRSNPRQSPNP